MIIRGRDVTVIAEIEPTAGGADFTGHYKPIGKATEHSLSTRRAADETTTKDDGNYKGKDYGMGELSGSISGLLFFNATPNIGPDELQLAQDTGKKVKLYLVYTNSTALSTTNTIGTDGLDGDLFLASSQTILATVMITSVEKSGSLEGKATYSVSYEADGKPTYGTIAAEDLTIET